MLGTSKMLNQSEGRNLKQSFPLITKASNQASGSLNIQNQSKEKQTVIFFFLSFFAKYCFVDVTESRN